MVETRYEHIQCFPVGKSYYYAGEYPNYTIKDGDTEREATEEEALAIHKNVLAERYIDREILCCDSSLVSDLLNAEDVLDGAFSWEDCVENVYVDPSDWDEVDCIEYMDDYDIDYEDVINIPTVDEVLAKLKELEGTRGYLEDEDIHLVWDSEGNWHLTFDYTPGEWEHFVFQSYQDHDQREVVEALIEEMADDCTTELDLDEARDKIRDYSMDHPAEVYQWFRVTSWLCEQLRSIGEVVLDNDYGYWWGRTCCGQAVIMDGTMQKIASKFV